MEKSIGRNLVVAFLALLVATPPTDAQESDSTRIEVEGVRPLVADAVPYRQVETYLAVNPTDSTNMIATALAGSEDGGLAYVTGDGGDTWKRVDGPGDPIFPGGDPMVDFDGDGRAYLSTLASGLSVWRSSDGGRSWSGPSEVGGTLDRQWVVAPDSSGEGRQPVYAAARSGRGPGAEIAVFVSRDGGRSFTETARMSPDIGVLNGVIDLKLTSDDALLLPYLAFRMRDRGKEVAPGRQIVLRSGDGGESWSGPHRASGRAVFTNAADRTFGGERRVSERETCLPSGYRWQNGGDTQGLVALPDGSFRTVWSGPGPHGPRPWTAEIETR